MGDLPSECCLCGSDTPEKTVNHDVPWTITIPFESNSKESKTANLHTCIRHTSQAHIHMHTMCLFYETSGHSDIHKDLAEKLILEICGKCFKYDMRLSDFFTKHQVSPKEEHAFRMQTVSIGSHNMRRLSIFPQFSDETGKTNKDIVKQHSEFPTRVTLSGNQHVPDTFLQVNISLTGPYFKHIFASTLCGLLSRFSVHCHDVDTLLRRESRMPKRRHKKLLWQVNETVSIALDKNAFRKRRHTHFLRLGGDYSLRVNDSAVEFETVLGTNPSKDTL